MMDHLSNGVDFKAKVSPKASGNPYYPDVQIFLILIPFIAAFNYYLTYSWPKPIGYFILTLSIDIIQGYASVWAIKKVILYLDRIYPYAGQEGRRIGLQLLSTSFVGLFVIAGLTELVSLIARGKMAPLSFYTFDLVIISIWTFLVNGIYTGLYFYNQWQKAEHLRKAQEQVERRGFLVKTGKQDLQLPFEDVSGFSLEGDYAVCYQKGGKRYYLDQSLKEILDSLPANQFFRLNRQYILHRQTISGFKRLSQGKIAALTKKTSPFPPNINISRSKAPDFKKWFSPE